MSSWSKVPGLPGIRFSRHVLLTPRTMTSVQSNVTSRLQNPGREITHLNPRKLQEMTLHTFYRSRCILQISKGKRRAGRDNIVQSQHPRARSLRTPSVNHLTLICWGFERDVIALSQTVVNPPEYSDWNIWLIPPKNSNYWVEPNCRLIELAEKTSRGGAAIVVMDKYMCTVWLTSSETITWV